MFYHVDTLFQAHENLMRRLVSVLTLSLFPLLYGCSSTPAPKPVAPTGLAVALADDFLKAADVQALAGSSPVLLLMAPQNGTGEAFSTQPLACPFSCVRSDCPMPLYRGQSSSHKANLIL